MEHSRNEFSYVLIVVEADWQVCEVRYTLFPTFAYIEKYSNKELKINRYAEQVFLIAVMFHSGHHSPYSTGIIKWENSMPMIFKYKITLALGTVASHNGTTLIEMKWEARKTRWCLIMAPMGTSNQNRSSNQNYDMLIQS